MELFTLAVPEAAASLGIALVVSSSNPLVLLDAQLAVVAASSSFCSGFALDSANVVGRSLFELGEGEWDVPQLRSLLRATVAGAAAIDAYEFELIRPDRPRLCLVVNAHVLDLPQAKGVFLAVAIADVTELRHGQRTNDNLVREKQVLLDELHHRVANSLQIIASVLMQSARRVGSEETRFHLRDAHHRVMSIATLQRQLAARTPGNVQLRSYFRDLCDSIGASMIADANVLQLRVAVDDGEATADVSVSLGLIVTELVINALKHAYPDRQQHGVIAVSYRSDKGAWTLSVGDDGVGMPKDAARMNPGLGTGIVEALAKQLDATIEVTAAKPGTCVTITHVARAENSARPLVRSL